MAEAGFEYLPTITPADPSYTRLLELNESLSPEQFTEQYGFGLSTLLELDFQDEGVMAFVEVLIGPPPSEPRSEGEQRAYEIALSGNSVSAEEVEDIQSDSIDNLGSRRGDSCRAYGYENADNSYGEKWFGLFEILGDEFDALYDKIDSDPRVREEQSAWQRCMAEQGFSYSNSEEAWREFSDETERIRNSFQGSPEALAIFAAAQEANIQSMNAEERFDFLGGQGAFQGMSMVPSLQVELDELIERELDVAGATFDCSDFDTYAEVRIEYEQAFVEEYGAQLELIAAGETPDN